jgi:hypothetical protein
MLAQSKSILAKLLATENITVEHKKISTAYFDTKNRVMALPIWKQMSPELYDLLLGHETGHALWTPNEGWHNNLKDKTKKGYKTYLNVIEDVRIERAIQEKFPGLRTSFRKGYSELMDADFFGVESSMLDLNTLPLIDRINLHYKIGSYLNLYFDDHEQKYIDRLDHIKTWDEVVAIVDELYENGKKELREELENSFRRGEGEGEGKDQDDYDDDIFDESDFEEVLDEGDLDPESATDKAFRKREQDLVDASIKPYHYANCPTPNLENIIVSYKRIKEFTPFIEHYQDYGAPKNTEQFNSDVDLAKTKLFAKFNETNKKYISYLIKEFEMKRNARQFARASVSKTGELDMKKIHQYKINDDLFKRMAVVPQGKSHGLVMFIDYSGSMYDNIRATIEQTLILATFCRKVNIPFRVYAFTDLDSGSYNAGKELSYGKDYANELLKLNTHTQNIKNKYLKFSNNPGELNLNNNKNFRLREYLSSEMSSIEFKDAAKYWLLVGELFARRSYRNKTPNNIVPFNLRLDEQYESLNGTPLNEAVVSSMEIVKIFKKQYRLDIVNTVFLTDGEANETFDIYDNERRRLPHGRYSDINVIIRDTKTMAEGRALPRASITVALLELLKATTGVNVIGFFIVPSYNPRRTILHTIEQTGKPVLDFEEKYKGFRKDKFFMINDVGYDDFYFIPGDSDLDAKDDDLVIEKDSNKNAIKKAFMQMQMSKSVNRVLLSRFVSKIA